VASGLRRQQLLFTLKIRQSKIILVTGNIMSICCSRMLFVAVCCPNGTYGMDCQECTGGRAQPCNGNGQCVVSTSRLFSGFTNDHFLSL